jgi:arsenite/tail-anchored protein-transporting ATPase
MTTGPEPPPATSAGPLHSSPLTLHSSRLILVGGKGGVGKTTTAAALGVALADQGRQVVVVSVDPAHSLGDALAVPLGAGPTPVPGVPGLSALEVDADGERRRFLETHRGALLALLERGTYLDSADASGLVDLTIPGLDELAALFMLRVLLRTHPHVIVDTAPTGHTLRLLELPELARGWLQALQAMEEKSRAVSTALVGKYRPDEASSLLADLDADLGGLTELLHDPERTRFVLVTGREPVVLAETLRYQDELARRGIPIGGIVVNRSRPTEPEEGQAAPLAYVPPLEREPVGVEMLRQFAARLFGSAPSTGQDDSVPASRSELRVGGAFRPPLDRALYLVGGKGGVGKSTVAAALAVQLQRHGSRVLLLSADPAGSLSEILGMSVGAQAVEVPGAPKLYARQLDATSDWEAFRSDYQAEAERLFGGLLPAARSPGSDRAVVERLVDLAPPGIDELAALMEVVDVTEDRPYDALVLDSAPTGHFLRLLELPEVALDWTHQVMRLLLKYREVVAPGELAERLLKLARSLRGFSERIRDGKRSWLLVVALPEALGIPEADRLLRRLRELRIEPGALLVNRLLLNGTVAPHAADAAGELLRGIDDNAAAAAPALDEGPRGVEALAAFASAWRVIDARGFTTPRENAV